MKISLNQVVKTLRARGIPFVSFEVGGMDVDDCVTLVDDRLTINVGNEWTPGPARLSVTLEDSEERFLLYPDRGKFDTMLKDLRDAMSKLDARGLGEAALAQLEALRTALDEDAVCGAIKGLHVVGTGSSGAKRSARTGKGAMRS